MDRSAICTQDHCALRTPGAGPDLVAALAVACLAGHELDDVVDDGEAIFDRKACADCVRRVMNGRRPFPTPEDIARDHDAGRKSYRRRRRRAAA
mgnify:CR=1 FL=1